MVELSHEHNLQPSLLDRLTDEQPELRQEPPSARVLSAHQLKESVRRDLALLLNARRLEDTQDLSAYPYIQSSVINLGLQDLAGLTRAEIDVPALEQAIRRAIIDYEPRLAKGTLRVKLQHEESVTATTRVGFLIEAELWAKPLPHKLFLRTDIDLECGKISIEADGG